MPKKEKNILRYSQSIEQTDIVKKLVTLVTEPQDAYDILSHTEIVFSSEAFAPDPSLSPSETEESIFEFLRDLAETSTQIQITVITKSFASPDFEEHEFMKAKIRAVFRAAIYGNISLFCEGAQTLSEFECFCNVMSKAFCELESERREFNGYITKGVLISTPLSAICLCSCPADIFCIDLDKMLPLITGNKNQSIDFLTDSTVSAVSKVLSDMFKASKKIIAVLSTSLSPCICELAEACGASEIWIKKQKSTNL